MGAALVVLFGSSACRQNAPSAHPAPEHTAIAVSRDEAEVNRAGRPPIVRFHLSARKATELAMVGVMVKATVSPDGVVTSAHAGPQDAPAELMSQAEAAVGKMRYRPFERDGGRIWATFEEQVLVLPPELKPLWHVPFPEVHDWKTVVVRLTRTGCLGACPSYRVEVHGDGTVAYEGKWSVAIEGKHQGSIPREKVRELVGRFRAADYYSLRDEYVLGATDLPTYTSSISMDGQSKQVKDYAGVAIGMPLAVSDLESSIDHFAEVERWTTGNADTVRGLRDEKWDFKSGEAAKALVRVAERGTIDAVRDLVAAGVPLNGRDDGTGGTPLTQAAYRGNVAMLRTLLDAGAARQDALGIGPAFAMACQAGNRDAIKLVLELGAAAGYRDAQGWTSLMWAATSGIPDAVEEILKSHPDVNARDKRGRTALMDAVGQTHYGAEKPEVKRARVVRLLLRSGADPNARDENGDTALIEAAWDADAALVLIEAGANINAQNKDGLTPLMNCIASEVARVLLAHGADVAIRDARGRTALDQAKESGQKERESLLSGKKQR
jgi:ankyrin repeat protein